MRGFNNDKLWLAFEASGCVGDYLNYSISRAVANEMNVVMSANKSVTPITGEIFNGFKDNRSYTKTEKSW